VYLVVGLAGDARLATPLQPGSCWGRAECGDLAVGGRICECYLAATAS